MTTTRRPDAISGSSLGKSYGFTLVELLVISAILATLGGLLIVNLRRAWQNERVLAVAVEFADWLELVKTFSMRNDVACQVAIEAGGDYQPGQRLASVTQVPDCAADLAAAGNGFNQFLIPQIPGGDYDIAVNQVAAPNNPFFYTPRGATTNIADVRVDFAFDGETARQCVVITPILGQVRLGRLIGDQCQS